VAPTVISSIQSCKYKVQFLISKKDRKKFLVGYSSLTVDYTNRNNEVVKVKIPDKEDTVLESLYNKSNLDEIGSLVDIGTASAASK
jgi:hypothetical protein